jgi:hypothetical protein
LLRFIRDLVTGRAGRPVSEWFVVEFDSDVVRVSAEPLRAAKLFLIEGGSPDRGVTPLGGEGEALKNLHAHPAVWAPFVLFGGVR